MVAKCSACKWQEAPYCGQICNQFNRCQVMVEQIQLFVHSNSVRIRLKEILEIRKCWFDRNTNLIFRNTANLKGRNITTSQWIFGGQSDQTWTCVLNPDLDFGKRLDVLIHTHGSKFRYIIISILQYIWWKEILEIRKCWFEWNTNLFSRNSANLKRRNIWTAQSKFNAHREQTLLTCFLILVSSWRGWTCSSSCTLMTPRSGT